MPLAWIALNSVRGLGPVKINALLKKYGSPEAIFKESGARHLSLNGISRDVEEQLKNRTCFEHAEKQLCCAQENDVRIVTLADTAYPPQLKEIYAPPPVIFIKGTLSVFDQHAVAIVGMRKPSPYGVKATGKITRELVSADIAIISGLALGIDTEAHRACLEAGGKTVAVLGCGIDTPYPRRNVGLAERIVENGAIVSEFPFGTPPEAFNFPRRNRIISGLSSGVLVVEAGKRSGSLITANYALQQNRDVFAVPGSIFSSHSVGTFNLIHNGAVPVRGAGEILDTISVVKNYLNMPDTPSANPNSLHVETLSSTEQSIYKALAETPLRMDQLAEISHCEIAELYGIVLNLELKGLIRQVSGQKYTRM
jgi:DNA processing protein